MKSRRVRAAGHVARMVEKRNTYTFLAGKPESYEEWYLQECYAVWLL
jgi:hypothetical protein